MPATRNTARTEAPVVEEVVTEAEVPEAPCRFPLEMRGDRCPVAVFNSPRSPKERISVSGEVGYRPPRFERGLLATFSESDANDVRRSNPGGSTYIEAEDRLAGDPLICTICSPKTRWYSARAYEQHTAFAHVG